MILASEIIDLTQVSPVLMVTSLVTFYVAAKWVIEQAKAIKDWYISRLKNYHETENEKEEKEDQTENRFTTIEEKLNKDYTRIQKVESQLYEIGETVKDMNSKFDYLNDMLVDLRLETMRGRILDFAPLAIDLSHPQSKERYTEIYKIHADYVKLIDESGKENNFETYNFELIQKSFEQRILNHSFTEDYYIPSTLNKPMNYKHETTENEYNSDNKN